MYKFKSSPEVWNESHYDYKSDMWSLGCLVYELSTLALPFEGDCVVSLSNNIKKGEYRALQVHFSAELATLVNVLLQQDPNERPTAGNTNTYV